MSSLKACISSDGYSIEAAYRDIPKDGSSYTFNLTDAEREALRASCTTANSRSVSFYIETVLGGVTYRNSLTKTLTIANAAPTLSPTVKDADAGAMQLTGSSAKFIRYYSDAAYTIGAAALKHASIVSQRVTCGAKSSEAASGTLADVGSGVFVFQATDSRGNTTTKTVTLPIAEYVHLSCVMDVTTPTADGDAVLRASGNFFNGSFGATANGLIVEYRQSTDGGSTWGGWTAVEATKSGSNYEATANITGLDYQTAYTFQARARDELEVATAEPKTVKAFPLFDWGENDFSFNVPVSADEGITVKGFELLQKQTIDGYAGLITASNDATSFIRTPIQGLIPYEDGGSGSLGTEGWPFNHLYVNNLNGNALADTVVAQGTSGGWTYRKWASGIAECWGRFSHSSVAITSRWGSTYESGLFEQAYPFIFVGSVACLITLSPNQGVGNVLSGIEIASTLAETTKTHRYAFTSETSATMNASANIIAIGRWK